jgi:hypothetical protein
MGSMVLDFWIFNNFAEEKGMLYNLNNHIFVVYN